jgi:hypothetical protein
MELNIETFKVFIEVNGYLLVEVSPTNVNAFESQFENLPFQKMGEVISNPILKISDVEIPVDELVHAFNTPN